MAERAGFADALRQSAEDDAVAIVAAVRETGRRDEELRPIFERMVDSVADKLRPLTCTAAGAEALARAACAGYLAALRLADNDSEACDGN